MAASAVGGDEHDLEEDEEVEDVAVRKAPLMPRSWNWNSGWKCRPRPSVPPAAKMSTQSASTDVSRSMVADRRSSTKLMPKGAGQLPSDRRGRHRPKKGDPRKHDREGGEHIRDHDRDDPLARQVVAQGQHEEGGRHRREDGRQDDELGRSPGSWSVSPSERGCFQIGAVGSPSRVAAQREHDDQGAHAGRR